MNVVSDIYEEWIHDTLSETIARTENINSKWKLFIQLNTIMSHKFLLPMHLHLYRVFWLIYIGKREREEWRVVQSKNLLENTFLEICVCL